ncbi:hypothetical protein RSSM_01941 [Rhodopirellula sallentina SM41]|uniref:Uncharacterized protein n=2 Tax=Rhodopirellula TaxID=265488 RepID=M5UKR9_9BACT|nr:hypothetical protein RSSM_01941 [Rhodopirellula sallentina SM41]
MAHMRRRLFRTLEFPERCIVAINCKVVSTDRMKEIADQFFADEVYRECHNLVLAIPADDAFAQSSAFDCVQAIKQSAFENHHDGKVSWLLIHHPDSELNALESLVRQQGGQWYGS